MTITEIAKLIADVIDYKGKIVFDTPNGAPRTSKLIEMGWRARASLRDGLGCYSEFLAGVRRVA